MPSVLEQFREAVEFEGYGNTRKYAYQVVLNPLEDDDPAFEGLDFLELAEACERAKPGDVFDVYVYDKSMRRYDWDDNLVDNVMFTVR